MKKTSTIVSIVAATALGTGLGATAIAPAHAAGTVWDRVAACESGGNWGISTGNGYYGGLQFSHSTWIAYGGGKYASNANHASKAQQIAIAKKVLQGQGPGAWPVCSRRAGLTRSNGLSVSTGTTAAPHRIARTTTVTKKTPRKTTAVTRTVTVRKPAVGARYITVKPGDTLGRIAARHGVGNWHKLWQLNRSTISNPNMIKVGQRIRIA